MSDGDTPPMRRSLLGLSRAAVDRQVQQQRTEYAERLGAIETQMSDALKEREELLRQVEELQERLKVSYHTNDVLRDKLYKERATNAVLAARVMQQQQAIDDAVKADMALRSEPKFKRVRVAAEIKREHEALQELIQMLYQVITQRAGAGATTSRLAPKAAAGSRLVRRGPAPASSQADESEAETAQAQAEAAMAAAAAATQADTAAQTDNAAQAEPPAGLAPSDTDQPGTRWHRFVVGKLVGRVIKTRDGNIFARDGDEITPELLQAAQEANLLLELVLNMRLPYDADEL